MLYVLDEPSVGLHPRDTERLTRVLLELRDRGNTVVVVEHDVDIIERADYLVDLGPGAGRYGGEVLYQGPLGRARHPKSKAIRYLNEGLPVRSPNGARPLNGDEICLEGVNEPMQGSGSFSMQPAAGERAAPAPRPGWLARLFTALFRFLYRLRHGRVERPAAGDTEAGSGTTRMTFRLRVEPGGPMAPMVNAMMKPMLVPAAEDLADKIVAHLEAQHGTR